MWCVTLLAFPVQSRSAVQGEREHVDQVSFLVVAGVGGQVNVQREDGFSSNAQEALARAGFID